MSYPILIIILLFFSVSSYKNIFLRISTHSEQRKYRSIQNSTRKLANETYCSEITSCFVCNVNDFNQFPCVWKDDLCRINHNKDSNNSHWAFQLNQCSDQNSFNIMEKFCGTLIGEVGENTITLQNSNLYGETSVSNLFCKWEYLHKHDSPFVIKINKISECKLSFTKTDKSTNLTQEIFFEDSLSEKFDSDNSLFTLYYYSEKLQNNQPFEIFIEGEQSFHFSKIILYFVISLGVFIFLLSMIILVFCFVKVLSKRIPPSQEINSNSSSNVSTPRNCLVIIKEFNLKQVTMEEKIKLFNKKCPICINEFVQGDEIAITLCEHGFHYKCIEEWIIKDPEKNNFCPLCNLNFKNSKKDENEKVRK